MFFSSSRCWLLILLVCLCYGCRRESEDCERVRKLSKGLKENQAHVSFKLADKEFYPDQNIFSGEVYVSRNALTITVTSLEGARSIVNFGGDDWYKKRPLKTNIFENGEAAASVKLGKIIDQEKMIGEGYMLTEGEVAILKFSPDELVLKVTGKAGKYSDFQQPDTLYPVKGMIVYKKPVISFGEITEKEIFGSTSSN